MSSFQNTGGGGRANLSFRRRLFRQTLGIVAARCRPGRFALAPRERVQTARLSRLLQAAAGGPAEAGLLAVSVSAGPAAMAATVAGVRATFRKGLLAKFGQRLYRSNDAMRRRVQNDIWNRLGKDFWGCFDAAPWSDLPQPVRAELRGGVIECLDFFTAAALLVDDAEAFHCLRPLMLQLTHVVPYGLTAEARPRWLVFVR